MAFLIVSSSHSFSSYMEYDTDTVYSMVDVDVDSIILCLIFCIHFSSLLSTSISISSHQKRQILSQGLTQFDKEFARCCNTSFHL
ncbi:MAG: hypothetical protein ACOZBL_01645 [Patescibacteria group bacterium]